MNWGGLPRLIPWTKVSDEKYRQACRIDVDDLGAPMTPTIANRPMAVDIAA